MKKQVSILFVLLYLVLTVGVAKSTHYCMGQVKSVAYFSYDGSTCFDSPFEKGLSCCDDEVELLKIEEDHQHSQKQLIGGAEYFLIPVYTPIEFTTLLNDNEDVLETSFESPPPVEDEPLYQLNCSYTFYG